MPFKVSPYRLQMIADIFCLLSVVFGLILLTVGLLLCILTIVGGFVFSYILYGVAAILHNTEDILDKLNELTPEKDDDDEN